MVLVNAIYCNFFLQIRFSHPAGKTFPKTRQTETPPVFVNKHTCWGGGTDGLILFALFGHNGIESIYILITLIKCFLLSH